MTVTRRTGSTRSTRSGSARAGKTWPVRRQAPSPSQLHRAWLDLVDTDGPFLAVPPLKRVWPQGMPSLPVEARDVLAAARVDFERAWEALDRSPGDEEIRDAYDQAARDWVRTVLGEVAGWGDLLDWGPLAAPDITAASPDRRVHVAATAALRGAYGPGTLVLLVPPSEDLRGTGTDGWADSAVDRMEALLRAGGVPIGIVTDGRWWGLVSSQRDILVASGVVDALTWAEETRTRDAFLTLIHRRHLIGGAEDERLPRLFKDSIAAAEEITEALGSQVRRAVELLVQAFSEADADARRHARPTALPADGDAVYQACVTVMMQAVFLLFAEERGLLPQSHLFSGGYGISGELDALERRALADGEESLDATSLIWHRLLATARALSRGASFEDVRIPAYGGSLFDQSRFPFLNATGPNGTLALTIPDRVMLHVLRSVQVAQLSGSDARRISFRDIDVEQIGYIYEGLLGYTCTPVDGVATLGLLGATGAEPEIPLTVLEDLSARHRSPKTLATAIMAWVKEDQPAARPASLAALTKHLTDPGNQDDAERYLRAVTDDEDLRERLLQWMPITRRDLRGRPTIVLDGGLMVTETQGDTREVGLDRMTARGFTITRAVRSAAWPSASVNLEYAAIWGTRSVVADSVIREADGIRVPRISTLLEPAGRHDGHPANLAENDGMAFIGNYVLGIGFILEAVEAEEMIRADPRNCEVIRPYLNGEDLNSRADSSPSRWVIDFNRLSEAEAAGFPLPFARVTSLVRPERAKASPAVAAANWWQHFRSRPALHSAMSNLPEVLAIAQVSKTAMPMRIPTGPVFDQKLCVFATDSFADQAALSSSLHQMWAYKYSSTMRLDLNYSPSDVFSTFPRPRVDDRLQSVGRVLDVSRKGIMLRRDLGLTRLYNLVNDPQVVGDPDVDRMRELHVEVDKVVVAAYGWSDVALDHGFHAYRQVRRWTIGPAARVELMDRLLEENQQRAAEEAKLSAASGRKGSAKRMPAVVADQEAMFDV